MDHEVARLIGAPPGYLGHRETPPLLTQNRLSSITSERSNRAIVVFDEIEKAARTLQNLLLGILDKGHLRTGDNNVVNFEKAIVFFTSNLGVREMKSLGRMGFHGTSTDEEKRKSIITATKKHFSPEFMNRLDEILIYNELSREDIRKILCIQVSNLEDFLNARLRAFPAITLGLTESAREWVIENGYSSEYGARELRRLLERLVLGQVAAMAPNLCLNANGGKTANHLIVDAIENKLEVSFANAA
jgi:ATP-dependent Clp protease ATP-binding subunit ClpA